MIELLVGLILIGVLLWVVETLIPMDPAIKTVIRVVVILCVVLWLLRAFGLLSLGDWPLAVQHR